jgi:dipeptidyl aminopeptidase/acylaminoacyl peptidase
MSRERIPPGLRLAAAATLMLAFGLAVPAQAPAPPHGVLDRETYLTPPKEIADAVLALRNENVTLTNLSPDGKKFLVAKTDGMPPIDRVGHPHVYLGGLAFDPVARRAHDLWVRSSAGFDLLFHADGRVVPVRIPDRARVGSPAWSPDGSKLAYLAHFEDASHIYVADTETGSSRRLTTSPVLATLATTLQWSPDGKRVATVLVPDDGLREPPKPVVVAAEPKVRVTRGGNNPSRTFRYLLESPHDLALLEYLVTGQVALIDVADGKVTKVGFPAMVRSVSTAPGEGQFRVATVKKPFSYFVPFANFGSQEGVWDLEGKSLVTLADRSLRLTEPAPPAPPTAAAAPATGTQASARAGRTGRGTGRQTDAGQPPTDPARPTADPAPTGPMPPDPGPAPDPLNPDAAPRRLQAADPDGKRDLAWRPDGAGLSYLQLEPARSTDDKEPRKDRVMQWLPPFGKDDTKIVYATPNRIAAANYSDDGRLLFLTQTVEGQRQITAIDLKDPKTTYPILKGSSSRTGPSSAVPTAPAPRPVGATAAAGSPHDESDDEQQPRGRGFAGGLGGNFGGPTLLTRPGRGGTVARVSSAGEAYLSGTDRTSGGSKPYLDKVEIKTGKKSRIFEGKGEMAETLDAVDGDDVKVVFTTRQKTDVVPDSYRTDLKTGTVTKLTHNVDPAPWVHKLVVQRFRVTRVDGFKFWVKVTTAPDAKGKLPALFWIYPREYADQAAYDQAAGRTGGAGAGGGNRFVAPNPRSMTLLTLAGYAVVEPDVPIVGPAGRMNDNYVPDLRNSLWAAIDDLDKRGIVDRDRLACGGHSYGAFSTANALAHTPFFKAGIAGDGNYNRTLTTMTFQTERRQIWDARETYLEMSPLLWANRVNGALLMYHGMDDANVGTNPINAEHMFMALDGLGKPAALYMYPYEGHGPIARETTLDLWARWVAWLDTYVKNPKPAKDAAEKAPEKK